ncbi:hypothetical protein CsSME_00026247 [Camellia sinensis var. sinensis]
MELTMPDTNRHLHISVKSLPRIVEEHLQQLIRNYTKPSRGYWSILHTRVSKMVGEFNSNFIRDCKLVGVAIEQSKLERMEK